MPNKHKATEAGPRASAEPRGPAILSLATIPAGQSISNSVACISGNAPQRLRMPAAWAGGMQDVVTVQTSTDNTMFFNLYDMRGQEISIIVVPGAVVMLADLNIGTAKIDTYIRLRAGTLRLPVIQPEDRVFTFVIG